MFSLPSRPSRSITAPSSSSCTGPSTEDNQYNSDEEIPTWNKGVYTQEALEHAYGEEEEELEEEIVCTMFLTRYDGVNTLL